MWGTSKLQPFLHGYSKEKRKKSREGASVGEIGRGRVLTKICGVAITFMAQWHPLIAPESGSLRPEHAT